MKKVIVVIMLLSLTGCQRICTRLNKNWQTSPRLYDIKQYSGGRCIGRYKFRGILNDAEGSDGYYFFKGDTLVEISGDITVRSVE